MSSQRSSAIGTLCRRPTAMLLPFAPLVLIALVALPLVDAIRTSLARPSAASTTTSELELVEAVEQAPRKGLQLRPRRVVASASAILGGVLIAASMAGGTYAFLNAQQTTPAVTVASGTLAVTVQAAGTVAGASTAIPTAAWSNMLPGDFVGQTITVANTGSTSTDMTARLSATIPWDIRIAVGACPSAQLTNSALTAAAVSYGTLPAGTSAVVCVQATLPTTALAGVEHTTSDFTITFDAKQVAP